MTYNDYRKFLNESNDFYVYMALTASEVDYAADNYGLKLTDKRFEQVCDFVYDWITNSEAQASEIADIVCSGLAKRKIKFADFEDYSESDYQSKAEIWVNDQI